MTATSQPRLLSTSLTAGSAAVPRVRGGEGAWFVLDDGRRVLDASNTAAPLGHNHPEMIEAVRKAAASPVVNEGWHWQDRDDAVSDLVRVALGSEDWVGGIRFFTSASEANDNALALCQALTGRDGFVVRERAYHGGAGLARELTVQPQWHGGVSLSSGGVLEPPRLARVYQLPAPTSARITGQSDPTIGDEWVGQAEEDLAHSAAVILDYSQGGVYHNSQYQDRVAGLARKAEALWIADETVTGFGRIGGWFQFEHGDTRPDIVTLGKCLAAGGAAAGALVLSRRVVDRLEGGSWQTYSTFRGHPVEVAAIRAHLKISVRDRVYDRARELDSSVAARMAQLASSHPSIARIDGRGLHWTIAAHGPDWRSWRGEEAEPLASRVSARALRAGALFATSGEQTSLFFAPPLIISQEEITHALDALDFGLQEADHVLEHTPS